MLHISVGARLIKEPWQVVGAFAAVFGVIMGMKMMEESPVSAGVDVLKLLIGLNLILLPGRIYLGNTGINAALGDRSRGRSDSLWLLLQSVALLALPALAAQPLHYFIGVAAIMTSNIAWLNHRLDELIDPVWGGKIKLGSPEFAQAATCYRALRLWRNNNFAFALLGLTVAAAFGASPYLPTVLALLLLLNSVVDLGMTSWAYVAALERDIGGH